MKLCIEVVNSAHTQRFEHEAGPLEFGRGPQRQARRCLIDGDPTVSRDQLRIELLADGRIRLENLSQRNPVVIPDFCRIAELHSMEVDLPVVMLAGQTKISIRPEAAAEPPATPRTSKWSRACGCKQRGPARKRQLTVFEKISAATAAQLGQWLPRIIALGQAGGGSAEFYRETARA